MEEILINDNPNIDVDDQTNDVNEEKVKNPAAAIEAIVFAAGYPMKYEKLAETLAITPSEVKRHVSEIAEKYSGDEHGIMMLMFPETCQFCTKEQHLSLIKEALGIKRGGNLSNSSMEVLAIVAYNQPVTRSFVDLVRGVDSNYAMNSLIDKALIECSGRLDAPGRPMLYGTTHDFLRAFGIESVDALPKTTDEMNAMFDKVRVAEQAENEDAMQEQMDIAADGSINEPADLTVTSDTTEAAIEAPSYEDEHSAEDDIIIDDM